MYFYKYEHPLNFNFNSSIELKTEDLGSSVYKLEANSERWKESYSQAELDASSFSTEISKCKLELDKNELSFGFVKSLPSYAMGVSGTKWMFCFEHKNDFRYYGLGEKNNGFEKTGLRTKFWNTDVLFDFEHKVCENMPTDPMYVSIPYLIIKNGNEYIGILADNPFDVFMSMNAHERIRDGQIVSLDEYFMIGSTDGKPELYFIHGDSLAELTRKFQKLCGCHHRPPLWTLGHQQSRFGYECASDLAEIDRKFSRYKFPNDGLWLDIDYMDRWRVFSTDPELFTDPQKEFSELRKNGRHSVAILDPGVAYSEDCELYQEGRTNDYFCQTPEGEHYLGYAWPGATVFPDFSLPECREWWAEHTAELLKNTGLDALWLDMNDPATGTISLDEMLFNHGKNKHATYHNQYAWGMQKATYEGCLKYAPNKRPFLISRSGSHTTSRYSAIWTGDNFSNYFHLRESIPMCLNLSLSGIPFCGPDMLGHFGNQTEALAVDWYKAGFLFPFFRNHSAKIFIEREPWQFSEKAFEVMRSYINLRYKLLPYLYNLFIEHEEKGDPVIRPLFYEFADSDELQLDRVDDQFMIGKFIMQAPFVDEDCEERKVILPAGCRWFDVFSGEWLDGGQTLTVKKNYTLSPVFIREGALIPMLRNLPETGANPTELADIEMHSFAPADSVCKTTIKYVFDDGETFDYRRGIQSIENFTADFAAGTDILKSETESDHAGKLKFVHFHNKKFEVVEFYKGKQLF